MRLNVSREPLFVFEFEETLFAFAFALLFARPTTRHRGNSTFFASPTCERERALLLLFFVLALALAPASLRQPGKVTIALCQAACFSSVFSPFFL